MSSLSPPPSSNLECPICCNEYDQHEHYPMVFPCGHSVCDSCRPRLQQCPNCRNAGVSSKNFGMVEAIKLLSERQRGSEEASASGGQAGDKCDSCKTKLATLYCCNCSYSGWHLCDSCDQSIHQANGAQSHSRVALSDKPDFVQPMCQRHPSQPVSHYCFTDNKAICSSCVDASNYCAHHQFETAAFARDGLAKFVDNIKNSIKVRLSEYSGDILNECEDRVRKPVTDLVLRLRRLVDEFEAAALRDVNVQIGNLAPLMRDYLNQKDAANSMLKKGEKLLSKVKSDMPNSLAVVGLADALAYLDDAGAVESGQLARTTEQLKQVNTDYSTVEQSLQAFRAACVLPQSMSSHSSSSAAPANERNVD